MSVEEIKDKTKSLKAFEKKIGKWSGKLDALEVKVGDGSAKYKHLKPDMDRRRAKLYDKIIDVRKELEGLWSEAGISDAESIALTEELEDGEAVKEAALAKLDRIDDETRTQAAWNVAEDFAGLNAKQMKAALGKVEDEDRLIAIIAYLDTLGNEDDENSEWRRQLEKAALVRLREVTVFEDSLKLIRKIFKGRKADETDLRRLELLITDLPRNEVLRIEKEVALWKAAGDQRKKTQVLDVIIGKNRGTDEEEAQKSNFSGPEADEIANKLLEIANSGDFESGECMKFVFQAALGEVFDSDEEQALLEDAKEAYAEGAQTREDEGGAHGKTFSRIAQEARQRGIMGPVNVFEWSGKVVETADGKKVPSAFRGKHSPAVGKVIDKLSNGGDGWYFFFCSVKSFHSFMIAVNKKGGTKEYYHIQDHTGYKIGTDSAKITKFFDTYGLEHEDDDWWIEHLKPAGSRVWQGYSSPSF